MHQDDFDIDRLAGYLHLSRERVSRMAERGKLPGRKVVGKWRFAQAEIHHWLEQRIGGLDADELVELVVRLRSQRCRNFIRTLGHRP